MSRPRLHYIFDPLCGWCYGASSLIEAARKVNGLDVALHAGGLMTGPNRQPVTAALRRYVLEHDQRIASSTGQPFGEAYLNGLLNDTGAVFDSEPPIDAILAAEALGGCGLDMLKRIQKAHYVEGRRVADRAVLVELAADIGLPEATFKPMLEKVTGPTAAKHIAASRDLLQRVGGQGFPTFAFDAGRGLETLDAARYFGHVAAWQAALVERVGVSRACGST
ncbi:MAG TPA: DsbA family protein [Gemmatimonadales bacterium]|nr:DsbA family protein [Gemmatimonadales bacterium]